MEWSKRLRVARSIAEALDCCTSAGFTSYNNLSAYTVLFDEVGDVCLSCFGLMKESKDGQRTTGSESLTYKFGYVLSNLLTGKQFPPNLDHAAMINGQKNVTEFLDPKLEGQCPMEEAILVFGLAAQCMEQDSRHIPTSEFLEMTKQHEEAASSGQQKLLAPLQTRSQHQGLPMKPANKVAGSRRCGPHRRIQKAEIQNEEERQAQKEESFNKWKTRQAEKATKLKENPKVKQSNPVQRKSNPTSKNNNSKTGTRF